MTINLASPDSAAALRRKVAVIGAGPAGCAAAFELASNGWNVVVYERDEAPGGRTRTFRDGRVVVDSGAGFFTNFYPRVNAYVRQLGLQVGEPGRNTTMVERGTRHALDLGSVSSFMTFPKLRWQNKLRMIAHTAWLTAQRARFDLGDSRVLARKDDASIADAARRLFGEDVYHYVVRPGIEPFWYFSCEDVSQALLFSLMARSADAQFFHLRDGMDALCRALLAQIDTRVLSEVRSIHADDRGVTVDGARYDAVVIATPAEVAHRLIAALPESVVPASARQFLASQRYVVSIHCTFAIPREALAGQAETTAYFACGPGEHPVGAIALNSAKFPEAVFARDGQEVLSVYLSAAEAARLLECSEPDVFGQVWDRARALCPWLPVECRPVALFRRPQGIPLHAVGRFREAAQFASRQRGPVVFAGDYLATATVEGAVQTGQFAARVLSV